MKIKILYDDLIKQINKIMKLTNVNRYDDCWLVVTMGYPIVDYVPIVDICIADSFNDDLEMNQELRVLSDVYSELEYYNQKELSIDKGFNNLGLFYDLTHDEGGYSDAIPWNMVSLLDEYDGYYYDDMSDDWLDEYSDDDFVNKAIDMCIYLDNTKNLVLNEDKHVFAFQLVKRLMRLMK